MTNESQSAVLLPEFEASFEAIAAALAVAAEKHSLGHAETAAELLGLKEQLDQRYEGFSATYIRERREGDLCLWLRTHWHDQSNPWTIRPDLHTLKLELRRGPTVLRSAESSYEE